MSPPAPPNKAFLSVVAWPDGASREEMVRLVAAHVGAAASGYALTPETIRLRMAIEPPVILGLADADGARAAVGALREAGGDAFAPTYDDLLSLGPTLKIKDLRIAGSGFDATLWRGPDSRIEFTDVLCLIRAHLSDTVVVRTPERARISQLHFVHRMPPSIRSEFVQDTKTSRLQTSDKLDVHTLDGRVFQLDGDRFGYAILGDLRGYSDKANMDKMFELLQHVACDAVPDMYFPLFRPPPGYDRLRVPQAKLNRDDPSFAFYSRWAALMYRYVLGGAG